MYIKISLIFLFGCHVHFSNGLCPTTIGPNEYNLLPNLAAQQDYSINDSTQGISWSWNLCGKPETYDPRCNTENGFVAVCASMPQKMSWGEAATHNQGVVEKADNGQPGVTITYNGGAIGNGCTQARKTIIYVRCSNSTVSNQT